MLDQNSKRLSIFEKNLSVEISINQGTSLRKLEKIVNEEDLVTALTFLIMRSMDFFNVGQKLNDIQAMTLATDLLEDDVFGYENIEDVVLLFKYARQGRIVGKIWRIDSQVITTEWIPQFLEIKAVARENSWNNEKQQLNNMVSFDWSEKALKKLEEMEIGSNADEINKKHHTGLGKHLKSWLGQSPMTEKWGDKKNPVDVEKMIKHNHKTIEEVNEK